VKIRAIFGCPADRQKHKETDVQTMTVKTELQRKVMEVMSGTAG